MQADKQTLGPTLITSRYVNYTNVLLRTVGIYATGTPTLYSSPARVVEVSFKVSLEQCTDHASYYSGHKRS